MKGIILVALLVLTSCASKNPTAPIEPPIVVQPLPSQPIEATELQIALSAVTSSCANVNWANRGKAPKGYIKGLALVYARQYCKPHTVIGKELGPTDKDALAYYGIKASSRNTFAFLIGLGMRESSGKYCEGRDMSASNTSANTAEAGMFQTSYDSVGASPALAGLMNEYHSECYLNTFKEGVSQCPSSNNTIYGSGAGAAFQQLARSCPAFATEWAAITVRTLRKHYGPINRKEVQFKTECVDMLTDVERIIDANPAICADL